MGRTLTTNLYFGTSEIEIPDADEIELYDLLKNSGVEEIYIGYEYHSIAFAIKDSIVSSYGGSGDVVFKEIEDDWFYLLERAVHVAHNALIKYYERIHADDEDGLEWALEDLWSPLDIVSDMGWKIAGSFG